MQVSVLVDQNGFSIRGCAIPWSSVRVIATYKRDLWIYDDIYLAFQAAPDSWVEVSEEEPGFQLLVAEVERRYPDVPRDWFGTVMHPAFATNYRVLWRVAEPAVAADCRPLKVGPLCPRHSNMLHPNRAMDRETDRLRCRRWFAASPVARLLSAWRCWHL